MTRTPPTRDMARAVALLRNTEDGTTRVGHTRRLTRTAGVWILYSYSYELCRIHGESVEIVAEGGPLNPTDILAVNSLSLLVLGREVLAPKAERSKGLRGLNGVRR